MGYATAQYGKNHLGDRNEYLPTVHGFDEFYGVLYHLNAMQDIFSYDYPKGTSSRSRVHVVSSTPVPATRTTQRSSRVGAKSENRSS